MTQAVKIVEVSPRDGLQNETRQLSLTGRVQLIKDLHQAGCKIIEAGSFVSPKWVPQMAQSADVFQAVQHLPIDLHMLVPNQKGLELAIESGVKEIAIFTAASDTFSMKNTNMNRQDSLKQLASVCQSAKTQNIKIRGYISCVMGCPYEGNVPLKNTVEIADALWDMGCYEISLGDTIGVGTVPQSQALFKSISESIPVTNIALHFHDTYGQALPNIYACLDLGAQIFDSSLHGLGGCPYAKDATGNIATEKLVYMLHGLGLQTGIDLDQLRAILIGWDNHS